MTSEHKGYIVTLEKNIREDDAEATIITALYCLKGVINVKPIKNIDNISLKEDYIDMARARKKLIDLIIDETFWKPNKTD